MSAATLCKNRYPAVTEKIKRLLLRGPNSVNSIRSLSRSFGIANTFECKALSRESFDKVLRDNHVTLNEEEVDAIFSFLDRAGTKSVNPAEFIAGLRQDASPLRRTWIRRVWESFSRNEEDTVTVDDLQRLYRAQKHPDVVRGKCSAAAVEQEFKATFNEETNPEGYVTRQEFGEYYAGVSAGCFDDEQFVSLLRGVWPMPGVCESFTTSLALGQLTINKTHSTFHSLSEKKEVTASRKYESELMRMLTDDHRPQVMKSGLSARLLSVALRLAGGGDDTGFLTVDAFCGAIHSRRLYITHVGALDMLDTNNDGTVDILYYLELLLPVMPASRCMMLERLWQTVFVRKDRRNRVDVKDLQSKFQAKNVQEKSDFLSAWDVRTALHGKVSLSELIEWYVPLSAKTQLDKEFETLLQRQWVGFGLVEKNS